jgi:hypothetical protein
LGRSATGKKYILYIVRETAIKKPWAILSGPTFRRVMFLRRYKDKQLFRGHSILTDGVFVIQQSSNAGISL